MSELVPYGALETSGEIESAAKDINRLVETNGESLLVRGLSDVVRRYGGSVHTTEENIRREKDEEDPLHRFYMGDNGDVWGAGSIHYGLKLTRSKLTLPALAKLALVTAEKFPCATPNVTGFVDGDNPAMLEDIYTMLTDEARSREINSSSPKGGARPWTLEPESAPETIHEAIAKARLEPVAVGAFNAGTPASVRPTRSVLYSRLKFNWSTTEEKLAELKRGNRMWSGVLNL